MSLFSAYLRRRRTGTTSNVATRPFAEYRWNDLARYNAEVSHGIVHTDEWKAKMARQQERFNEAHGRNQDGSYKPR